MSIIVTLVKSLLVFRYGFYDRTCDMLRTQLDLVVDQRENVVSYHVILKRPIVNCNLYTNILNCVTNPT